MSDYQCSTTFPDDRECDGRLLIIEAHLRDALHLMSIVQAWAKLLDVYAADYAVRQIAPGAVASLRRAAQAAQRLTRNRTPPAPTTASPPARTARGTRTR